ncbi:hypothetical protein OHA74_53090 [Streptomyces phaeochromogenes]|uniref:hypothetical protein n=1 Tax=Streptomyces phaeochromogenes TaxID=1923 RepID=UPI002E29DC2E|nr:hypothetical protein [Streptomyces phaeochromogenes]
MAQAAREEAWLVDARARRDAEISRIILMRTTARTWRNLLADSIAMLGLGVPVDRTSFEEKVTATRNAAQSAFDHALHDGIWIPQGPYGSHFAAGDHPVMYEFNRLTDLVRSEIETVASGESVGPLERERLQALLRAQDEADAARGELSSFFLERLERLMDVTVMPPTAPTPATEGTPSQRALGYPARTVGEGSAGTFQNDGGRN